MDDFLTSGNSNNNHKSNEIWSKKIEAKHRTFYVDLKESSNGKFLKISEKSSKGRSTIMMDIEDLTDFIQALKEVKEEAEK